MTFGHLFVIYQDNNINANIQTIKNVDKWIGFAGAVISLAASIATGNGGGILSSAETIFGTFNVKMPG